MKRRKNASPTPAELSVLTGLASEYGHTDPTSGIHEADDIRQPYTAAQWHEISQRLKTIVSAQSRTRMLTLAQGIREGLLWCDDTMDRYCAATCHACLDFCCSADGIYYDLADLVYLLTLDNDLPASQTRATRGAPCRYLSPEGCILPRMCRPFICTWYLCEPQMNLLEAEPISFQKQFTAVMQSIRRCRQQLIFIHATNLAGTR